MEDQPKGKIIVAVGLPGSGKSTYFARHGIQPLSSDTLRLWLLDDERDQRSQPVIFRTLRNLLRIRLLLHRPRNYVDATNLTPFERQFYIGLARRFSVEAEAIFFDVPLETCLRRNRRRRRPVPDDVMHEMAAKLVPPSVAEGFSRIHVVRRGVKKME
jgi:predicted kinase